MKALMKRGLLCYLLVMSVIFAGCSSTDGTDLQDAKNVCSSFTQLMYNISSKEGLSNNMSKAKLLCSTNIYNKRCNLSDTAILDRYFVFYRGAKYESTISSNAGEKIKDKEYKVTVIVETQHYVDGKKDGEKSNLAINYVVKDGKIILMQEFNGLDLTLQ